MGAFASREAIANHKTALQRLITDVTRPLRRAGVDMAEMRVLVNRYYMAQEDRKRAANQARSLAQNGESVMVMRWIMAESELLEAAMRRIVEAATKQSVFCQWAQSIPGIGPVLSAGFYANLDVTKTKTAGGFWRFAGQDPTAVWGKGKKRPWNADLKKMCWLLGESFVKVRGRQNASIYSEIIMSKKEMLWRKNIHGGFAERAISDADRYREVTDAWKWYSGRADFDLDKFDDWVDDGMKSTHAPVKFLDEPTATRMLPPAHIHSMAKRYGVKLFLAHCFEVMYWLEYRKAPPKPYILTQEGHVHAIEPPNLDQFPALDGLSRAIWQNG